MGHPKKIKKRSKSKRTKSHSLNIEKSKLPKIKNRVKTKQKSQSLMNEDFNFLIRRKSEMKSTEQNLSKLSQQRLLKIEREEFEREREKFYFVKKKHDAEVWAVKNDYIEQTKLLKSQYNVYKQSCDHLQSLNVPSDIIKYHKLETKEKLIKDSQKSIEKRQKTAQILFASSNDLLEKIQSASLKMEVYENAIKSKCIEERQLIKKQEVDPREYLTKCRKLRDEMLSAPWLILSDNASKDNVNYSELRRTYELIREERLKFIPMQGKWAKLIANYQIYNHEVSNLNKIRNKLEKMRAYQKEFKLKLVEEIKQMLNLNDFDANQQCIQLKKREILLKYQSHCIQDKERQIKNELKLQRLHQRNLDESLIEIECERELIAAQKTKNNTASKQDMNELNVKYQAAMHKIEKLEMQLTHFQDDSDKKQSYDKLSKVMESLTQQFETM